MFARFQSVYVLHIRMSMCVNVGGTASPCCRFDENFVCLTVPNAQHSKNNVDMYTGGRTSFHIINCSLLLARHYNVYIHDIYIRACMLDPQVENSVGVLKNHKCILSAFSLWYKDDYFLRISFRKKSF